MNATDASVDPSLPETGETLLDRDHVAELVAACGPEMLRELTRSLEEEAAGDLAVLAAAVAEGDCTRAAARLHSLKGAALSIGCVALGGLAGSLEAAARAGELPHPVAVARLGFLLETSVAALSGEAEP